MDRSISVSTEVAGNRRACCGTMSPVRRTFSLFVTFDLILCFILWVLHTRLAYGGLSIGDAFWLEVKKYDITLSLFDIVLCSAWRFAPLILAYSLFRINNPSIVALTTLGTCIFLITKVFMFNFAQHNDPIVITGLVTSFILAWAETWFLDFKVLPVEKKTRLEERYVHPTVVPSSDERAPLLDPRLGAPSLVSGPYVSLPGSAVSSVWGGEGHSGYGPRLDRAQRQEYSMQAARCWFQILDIYQDLTSWTLVAGTDVTEGCVRCKTISPWGNVFRVEALLECSPEQLFQEICQNVREVPHWNPSITEYEIVDTIDACTDVVYSVTADAAGGLVRSRDFVVVRHWKWHGDSVLLAAGESVEHPAKPADSRYVRGHNHPTCFAFSRVAGQRQRCQLTWIINTDLKGWLPKSAVDQGLLSYTMDYLRHLKVRVKDKYSWPAGDSAAAIAEEYHVTAGEEYHAPGDTFD